MINHSKQSIFVHIPKTAGTSVSIALDEKKDHAHSTLDTILKQEMGRNLISRIFRRRILGYFKFAFIRNPWDRAVSLYMEKKQTGWLDEDLEFSEYIRYVYSEPEKISEDPNLMFHCQPCHHWLTTNGKLMMDFIGRFEHLQSDYNAICDKLGIQAKTLPVLRKRGRPHYSSYYTDETRRIVAEYNEIDIKQFSYRFEYQS